MCFLLATTSSSPKHPTCKPKNVKIALPHKYWWKHLSLSLSLSLQSKEHTQPKNLCLSSIHVNTTLSHLQTRALVTKKCAWSFSLLMVGISSSWLGPWLWGTIFSPAIETTTMTTNNYRLASNFLWRQWHFLSWSCFFTFD